MADLLVNVINNQRIDDPAHIFKQIDKMENTGDNITHKIYLCLDKVIFTPLNRNDIHALASAIDDVADTIKEASGRMYLYNIEDFTPAIKQIAAIILKASLEIEKAIGLLRSSKKANDVFGLCRQIRNYERQSDLVYYQAVATLFENEKDAIKLLKYRGILFSLQTSVNKCKNVTDVLNTILING
jgi:predicted phosphate transport protein (TIGR00153 family)